MRNRNLAALAGLALLAAACGMPPPGGSGRASRNVITAAQMLEVNASDVFDAVQKLEPDWLTSRGTVSMTDGSPAVASVFLSGSQMGTVEYLRTLRPDDVDEVRYYEAGEASARFGMGHPRGVIDVIVRGTRR